VTPRLRTLASSSSGSVAHVDTLRTAASLPATSAEVGLAGKKAIVRSLLGSIGWTVVGERPIDHGYQFKLGSLRGNGALTLYESGSVVVGAPAAVRAELDAFAAEYLQEPTPEVRGTVTVRLPGPRVQSEAGGRIRELGADELAPGEHEQWRFKLARGKSAATAVLYRSGKFVLQGTAPAHDVIREALATLLAHHAGAEILRSEPAAARVRARRADANDEPWIGTDESGKGDFFGPLVSAAVYVDSRVAARLEQLGVRDSKKLSDRRVNALAPQLRQILGRRARVTVIQPARFNSLYAEMRAEGKNLNSLLAWGHFRSTVDLLDAGARPAYLIVDQFADAKYIEQRLASEARRRDIEILQFPKAEADVAVAAASVLAREAFIHWLERESETCGIALPKGAGDQAVTAGRRVVEELGERSCASSPRSRSGQSRRYSLRRSLW
jgi:ribonuclease HIII